MASPPSDLPDQTPIVDVAGERLADLVRRTDPELVESLAQLTALLGQSPEIQLGWNSAITYE